MNHIEYLTETLIPDLRASGMDATAEDFQTCADMIRELTEVLELALSVLRGLTIPDKGQCAQRDLCALSMSMTLTKVKGGNP